MSVTAAPAGARVGDLRVRVYRIPTENGPESDGTLVWDATVMVYVEVEAAGHTGIGWTYASPAAARVIDDELRDAVVGSDVFRHLETWTKMVAAIRNLGRPGISSMAISACDVALWDLKAKLLGTPLCAVLGMVREEVPVYGSGGFTSYDFDTLCAQLAGWSEAGFQRVKMKVGRDAHADLERVRAARRAIGERCELFVDANGAYARKQALMQALRFEDEGVTWFEEPVYHLDFEGLREVRERLPPAMELSAGEYGFDPLYFAKLLDGRCVDVLQADATRCGGFTGFLIADGLCVSKAIPLSSHCAPYLHLHAAAAAKMLRHVEYFHDHVRIAKLFFDGVAPPVGGSLRPDPARPGIGLEFKSRDAERYAI